MSTPLIFYDISSPLQPRSYAPNPSKTRLALSFKRVPFTTKWVDILDIPATRKALNCAAVRKLDDGSDYYTLPMLQDPASGAVVGDSFDIANYLEQQFPDSGGCLFPKGSTRTGLDYVTPFKDSVFYAPLSIRDGADNPEYAEFNVNVDTTFTVNMQLVGYFLPFNPETAEECRVLFAKRAHLPSWETLRVPPEDRPKLMAAFKDAIATLAACFKVHDGPYLEGQQANYADLIVGGWLNCFFETMPAEEWAEFRTWHDGVFARLHDALQKDHYICN
ncbi:hypothetical protein MNEG_12729 [Monoraphidium neglectum]|uniref:GST N-terminal domain-containing protein n=1 Tax=Monoraphidium neglectum TaxID=145388 RepID=A0A0D2LU97_9CHLO|nr:hypothetical protein MNEG_12729 [Monoraphidium neglectum]KIY95234.1 hypothetical protein MNEG_12729 [Monoraphidium neglectum]|eukprot:XP_013894254.1 hypothetical protein MNEG_12729 [Monoraphidium neglectum]